jgi:ubiquinone/menaquinone biosynthesis C-methylase UbiE
VNRRAHDDLEQRLLSLLAPIAGTERVLDAGCGRGALALALAAHVAEVVGVDESDESLAAARDGAPANATFVSGDVTALPFPFGAFDIAVCRGVLHHVRRPELVVSELARVTRPGGLVLVVDRLGDVDPLVAIEADRYWRQLHPGHQRFLPDGDVRQLLDANNLVVRSAESTHASGDGQAFEMGWYVARVPGG